MVGFCLFVFSGTCFPSGIQVLRQPLPPHDFGYIWNPLIISPLSVCF